MDNTMSPTCKGQLMKPDLLSNSGNNAPTFIGKVKISTKNDHSVLTVENEGSTIEDGLHKLKMSHWERWEEMFRRLMKFRDENGHCLVPKRYTEDRQLGAWVATQRRYYKASKAGKTNRKSRMTSDRALRLTEIGFDWLGKEKSAELRWESQYKNLLKYVIEHGHALVPIGWEQNPPLANWVSNQRQEYKHILKGKESSLNQERMSLLNSVGFIWEAPMSGLGRVRDALKKSKSVSGLSDVQISAKRILESMQSTGLSSISSGTGADASLSSAAIGKTDFTVDGAKPVIATAISASASIANVITPRDPVAEGASPALAAAIPRCKDEVVESNTAASQRLKSNGYDNQDLVCGRITGESKNPGTLSEQDSQANRCINQALDVTNTLGQVLNVMTNVGMRNNITPNIAHANMSGVTTGLPANDLLVASIAKLVEGLGPAVLPVTNNSITTISAPLLPMFHNGSAYVAQNLTAAPPFQVSLAGLQSQQVVNNPPASFISTTEHVSIQQQQQLQQQSQAALLQLANIIHEGSNTPTAVVSAPTTCQILYLQ